MRKGTRLANNRELSRHSKQHNMETPQSESREAHRNKDNSTTREMDTRKSGAHHILQLIQNGSLSRP